jgi:poly-gamma-glutamate capsule biosynthesis protein CapA/YwtB (metallophosphatase superfamily)
MTGERDKTVRLLLCGDVMTGRGVDQILPQPGDPTLHEDYVRDARRYVELAKRSTARFRAQSTTPGHGVMLCGSSKRPLPTYCW